MASRPSQSDSLNQQQPARYVVGIDLGTTNSAVAYVDTAEQPWRIGIFSLPQLVAPGQVDARDTLPSFHYEPVTVETQQGALRLPWSSADPKFTVGVFARDHGAKAPGRLIASAKSWLSHSGVDRTAELLPWHGADDVERLSPIEVSARYLQHMHDAWNQRFPHAPLAEQEVVLTLPASFDEVARELTVAAAARAGLPRVVLIEEPQAAFYAWVYQHSDDWENLVQPGQKILVCDIGGGTSDFTLIRVRRSEDGKTQFHRVAVGEHLILGGDNLDLALAHHLEPRFAGEGRQLQPRQWELLVRVCRRLKEDLLAVDPPDRVTANLPAAGSKLIGGAVQIEVTRDEVQQLVLEGFFPSVALDERPAARRSGFQEFGLPYATDPAITRNLAAFLTAHRHVDLEQNAAPTEDDPARPDVLLFNGGVFDSPLLKQAVLDALQSWFPAAGTQQKLQVLENDRLHLAVARGAAYYGMVLRGKGVRIAAKLARTYYIGVAGKEETTVCLLPGTALPGEEIELQQPSFELQVSEPVEFPLYVSSTRLTDRPGDLVPFDDQKMKALPPIRTVLRTRGRRDAEPARVHLHARLTEIGTIDLWCSDVDQNRSWRLQFDVRSTTQTDMAEHESAAEQEGFVDESTWYECQRLIEGTFAGETGVKPDALVHSLVHVIGTPRGQWPTSLLRRIWESLMEVESGRRRSAAHETRWLNLLGYALRPGYGLAVDDWRVSETWRIVQGKLVHGSQGCRNQSWILWRRIGGGLSSGQQRAVAGPLLNPIRAAHRRSTGGKKRSDVTFSPQESIEIWRLIGSLELLDVAQKIEIGNMAVDLMNRRSMQPVRSAMVWALGRIGARAPLYGPVNRLVPVDVAAGWLETVVTSRQGDEADALAVMQLSRRTDDRYRDVDQSVRQAAIGWLESHDVPGHFVELVREGGRLDSEEQNRIFGEALPKGLRIQ
ncbi:MAG: hsp70 family protein [Planctomycetota bacterium]|nr:hsp70 family protein [Planctomycetota bacterium]